MPLKPPRPDANEYSLAYSKRGSDEGEFSGFGQHTYQQPVASSSTDDDTLKKAHHYEYDMSGAKVPDDPPPEYALASNPADSHYYSAAVQQNESAYHDYAQALPPPRNNYGWTSAAPDVVRSSKPWKSSEPAPETTYYTRPTPLLNPDEDDNEDEDEECAGFSFYPPLHPDEHVQEGYLEF